MHVVSSSIFRCRRTENRDRASFVRADNGSCYFAALDGTSLLTAEWARGGATTLAADGHDAEAHSAPK